MKTIYLVCTRSAVTASALTYIINASPDFYNMAHNNVWLEEHSEWFGKAHIINDWWNVHDFIAGEYGYNEDFRNTIELTEDQLGKVVDSWDKFPSDKHICLFTHARNVNEIMQYAADNDWPVKTVTTTMGENSHHFISAFLRREYNEEMNSFEDLFEVWKYIYYQLTAQDNFWQESNDYCFQMSDWLHSPQTIYSTLGVAHATDIDQWTSQYLRWNNSDDIVAPTNCKLSDKIEQRMLFLTWAFNTHITKEMTSADKIMFAILLFRLYNKDYTVEIDKLISDAKKTLGFA